MSKNSEVIYDITEHFAEIDDMVDIDNFIVLRGNYINYGSNKIELRDTEIYLEYDYISYISDVNWNNRSEEEYGGISIIRLKQGEKVPLNDKLKNFEFLYFDFISTNSVGTITSLQTGTITESSRAPVEIREDENPDFPSLSKDVSLRRALSKSVGVSSESEGAGRVNFPGFPSSGVRLTTKKIINDRVNFTPVIMESDINKVREEINKGADLIGKSTVKRDFSENPIFQNAEWKNLKRGDVVYTVFKKKNPAKFTDNDFMDIPANERHMTEFVDYEIFEKNIVESFASQDTFIGSIEVCKTNFMNLSSVNRSTIKTDNCSRGVGFNISSNHLRTVKSPAYRGYVPSTYNICVDLSMKVRLPNCPSNYQKCWKGGAYQPGRCYIKTKQGDRTITTDCNGNNCMRPDGKINKNINYWLVGNGRVDCQGPTNMKEKKDGVVDVDDLSSNRFIDLDGEERRTRNLRNKIFKMQEKVEKQKLDMVSNEKQMKDTQLWIDYNKSLIKMKMNLLDNRNRQMELSMDRNIYWKKVLYVLFALVIAVVMICLFLTSFIKNQN